jgi:hypothetical protein
MEEAMFAWFVPPIVIPAVLVTLVFALALYQLFGAAKTFQHDITVFRATLLS